MTEGIFPLAKVGNKGNNLVIGRGLYRFRGQGTQNTPSEITEKMLWGSKRHRRQFGIIKKDKIQNTLNWWV